MRLSYIAIFLGLAGWLVCSRAPVGADIIPAQRAEDKRLEAPVTLSETRIHVAELLSRLSAQTGVDLKINARMDASGITLMTSLVHLPLADAMNAFASLVGCRSARWYWERQGEPGHFTYWLQPPQLRETAARLRARVRNGFESQAAILIKAAHMTPEERKELMGRSKADDAAMIDARVMSGVKIFSEAVPVEMQQRILRGETTLKLPVSQLSPEGQAYVRSEYRLVGIVDKVPAFVNFEVDTIGLISPSLFMEVGDIGGHGYVGGVPLDNQFKAEIVGEWMLPGDTLTDAFDNLEVARPKDYKPTILPEVDLIHADELPREALAEYFARFTSIVQKRLAQMSQATPVSLLAIVPTSQRDAGEPYGQTVGHFVAGLRQSDGLFSKWHGKTLLVNYGNWFLNMDACTPFNTVERLREQQRKEQGIFSLADLAAAADSDMSGRQLASLTDDFKVFKSVSDLRGVFTAYHRYPGVQAAGGIRLTPELAQIINQSAAIKVAGAGEGTRVRIHQILTTIDGRPASTIFLETFSSDGGQLGGIKVKQKAPPPAGK